MFKPHRLRRIWHAAGAFGRRDPTLFIAAFALWMVLSGASLLAPGDAFTRTPVYTIAREMGLDENVVGASMVLNALALLWGLGDRPPRVRSWLAFISGILWCFWALLMFFSGLRVGLVSSAAVWTALVSFGLMRTPSSYIVVEPLPPLPPSWEDG